jgi:8-oxo-dGTP pyrophosphatase MutT (NUDIX family)
MPIPEFIRALREHVGSAPLWLPAVAAVVVRPGAAGEEVLLVRRADNGAWTPVTGILDPGEEPAVGAMREVLEETGVVAVADRLVWAHATHEVEFENGDRSAFLSLCFRCSWVSGDPYVADDESSDTRWFGVGELPDLEPDQRRRIDLALADAPEAVFAR